jgi:tetratricopeptide (TPR) repeat protein
MTDPLEDGGRTEDTTSGPLAAVVSQARAAAARGDWPAAIESGEQVVELVRQAGDSREALTTLSVMLFNLSGYYAEAERFDDAVRALEEVVALDERTGHEDLAADRRALEQARMLAAMSPEERAAFQRQAEEFATRLQNMSPEERAELQDHARRVEIQQLVEHIQKKALASLGGDGDGRPLIENLRKAAQQAWTDDHLGEAREDVAGYFAAVAAILSGEAPTFVPAAYAPQIAELRESSP